MSMIINPYAFATGASLIGWNPSDKSAALTLSDNDRLATNSNTGTDYLGLRGRRGHSAGKLYFEVQKSSATATAWYGGVAESSTTLTGRPGVDFTSGQGVFVAFRGNGNLATPAGSSDIASDLADGATVGIAVDFTAKTVQVYVGGSAVGSGLYTWTPDGITLYPYAVLQSSNSNTRTARLLTTSAEFLQSIPSGYSEWGT
jgi:hypothetical protein